MVKKVGRSTGADTGAEQPPVVAGANDTGNTSAPVADSGSAESGWRVGDAIRVDPGEVLGGASGGNSGSDSGGSAESGPKRRGRKPGTKNRAKTDTASLDVQGISALLFSIHLGVSAIAKAPELALDQEESDKLAKATANVARHYGIAASAKVLDWAALFATLGAVYGPRIILINMRTRSERTQNPSTATATPSPAKGNGAARSGTTIPGTNIDPAVVSAIPRN